MINHDFVIKMLPVLNGDCISINFLGNDHNRHNIIIDGGFQGTYQNTLKQEVERVKEEEELIDLLVVTHTDQDHIGGVIKLIQDYGEEGVIKKVWYNSSSGDPNLDLSGMISIKDGIRLRELLLELELLKDIQITNELDSFDLAGAKLSVVSPGSKELERVIDEFEKFCSEESMISLTEPDHGFTVERLIENEFNEGDQLYNASSIGLLIKLCGAKVLLLSDCVPSVIIKWLKENGYSKSKKLKVDYMSVPHHGSKRNINDEMISLIDCDNFLVSANGQNRYNLPHKESLARIVHSSVSSNPKIYFNYDNDVLRSIFSIQEIEDYNISCFYGDHSKNGLIITN